MPEIHFTQALKRFFPNLGPVRSDKSSIPDIMEELDEKYPGISGYILDDQGHLRKHVNIFIDGRMISDRTGLTDAVGEHTEVYIMQALSGG